MLSEYQARVNAAILSGRHIDDVDKDIIQPSPLSDDQKGALWLFAWSRQSRRRQRRIAAELLTLVDA